MALGGEARIVNPLYAAKKIYATKKISFLLQALASVSAFVGVLVFMLTSQQDILSPSLFGLHYLAWILASAILSFININKRTLHLRREK